MPSSAWPPRYDPSYRPARDAEYWSPDLECAEPKDRDGIILAKLQHQVRYAWEKSAFYRRRWDAAGVSPDSLRSLAKIGRAHV